MSKPGVALIASRLSDRLFALEALSECYDVEYFEPPIPWSELRRVPVIGALLVPSRSLNAQVFCSKNISESRPLWCAVWDPSGEVSDPTALLCMEHVYGYWGGALSSPELLSLVVAANQHRSRMINRLGLSTRLRRKFRL